MNPSGFVVSANILYGASGLNSRYLKLALSLQLLVIRLHWSSMHSFFLLCLKKSVYPLLIAIEVPELYASGPTRNFNGSKDSEQSKAFARMTNYLLYD